MSFETSRRLQIGLALLVILGTGILVYNQPFDSTAVANNSVVIRAQEKPQGVKRKLDNGTVLARVNVVE
ncbi:MAG: hypothetical protein ABEK50_16245 [bacterium]